MHLSEYRLDIDDYILPHKLSITKAIATETTQTNIRVFMFIIRGSFLQVTFSLTVKLVRIYVMYTYGQLDIITY